MGGSWCGVEAAVFLMRKRILRSWGRRGRGRQQSRHHNQGAGFWNRGLSWRRWLFSSTPVLHTHRARQPRSCAWLSPGNGGGALTPDHFPPLREESHRPSSHPGELTAPLPTSAFLSRGDVRISNLRRGALAHLRGGLMPRQQSWPRCISKPRAWAALPELPPSPLGGRLWPDTAVPEEPTDSSCSGVTGGLRLSAPSYYLLQLPGPPENLFPVCEDVIITATSKQFVSDILKTGA